MIGWLADRSERRNILTGSVVTRSVMALFCGLATNYGGLIVAHIGVGVGDAALTPAVFSFLADYSADQGSFAASSTRMLTTVGWGYSVCRREG
jgi:MFS family permease